LLGFVHFLFHRTTIALTSNCYLEDLFTIEAARGKVVGRALIEEVYRRAKQAGSAEVYWQTPGDECNCDEVVWQGRSEMKSGFLVYQKTL
jgi:GNAT superfamily N-acetyltransferase